MNKSSILRVNLDYLCAIAFIHLPHILKALVVSGCRILSFRYLGASLKLVFLGYMSN